jgi:hypothetical protein
MFHPAAALHQPKFKPQILADFAKLPKLLEQARTDLAQAGSNDQDDGAPAEDPKQLNLF